MEPKPGQWSQQDPHMDPAAWQQYVAATCSSIDGRMRLHHARRLATQLRESLFCARALATTWAPAVGMDMLLDDAYEAAAELWRLAQSGAIAAQIELEAMQRSDVLDEEPPCAN